MKVILLKDIAKVGKKYEVKDVPDGHALNFLIPNKLVKVATKNSLKSLETEKTQTEEKEEERVKDLKENVEKLSKEVLEIKAKANDEGHLFAGVGKNEIATAIKEKFGFDVEEYLVLDKPIKEVGEHEVEIKAGDDKKVVLKVKISG
ncbi:50S ribosomal protein L9 [Patescibacteria group bacterium]